MALMREERIFFENRRGDRLIGVLHYPEPEVPRGAVILCHGMESDKNSEKLVYLSRELAARGFVALRFDFSFVGESSGKFEDITWSGEAEDLRAAYGFLTRRHKAKTALLGSSMGGTVALMFAAEEPEIAALVTVAAPLHPERFPDRILTVEQLNDWRQRGSIVFNGRRLNGTLLEDLSRIDVVACARKITCPTLILHGEADAVVPVAEAHELYGCLSSQKQLCILPATDHRLSNPQMMDRAVNESLDWLMRHLG
jgi:alpha-beta hydrolase superfamily lysophospholipase